METTTPAIPPTSAPARPLPNSAEVLQKMLNLLGIPAKVERYPLEESALLHINTEDPGRLIGKHGQTLIQMQFLLNRMLQRMHPDAEHVVLDCERYREQQHEETLKKATDAAEKVRRWGDAVVLGPLSVLDRRLIHQHFDHDAEIEAVADEREEGGRKKMIIRIRQKSNDRP